ncbi:hypothetical protein OPT61_g4476 [Boeremia exigua]|uniref:Uncharacterized protein n=1 Tax=Boeremia exigua TaxID=749465 RepID=A0ACC2IDX4_9PLEO|nr:hypothetical protein OPT61_g4476 [Boeremia exigua]
MLKNPGGSKRGHGDVLLDRWSGRLGARPHRNSSVAAKQANQRLLSPGRHARRIWRLTLSGLQQGNCAAARPPMTSGEAESRGQLHAFQWAPQRLRVLRATAPSSSIWPAAAPRPPCSVHVQASKPAASQQGAQRSRDEPARPAKNRAAALTGYSSESCGYCKDASSGQRRPNSRASYYFSSKSLSVDVYQSLVDRGWRRSGTIFYKPDVLRHCCPHYTIRLPAAELKLSKDQRRTVNKWNDFVLGEEYKQGAAKLHPVSKQEKARLKNEFNLLQEVHRAELENVKQPPEPAHRFEVTLEPADFTAEKFELFHNYQSHVHKEKSSEISQSGFKRFLCTSPLQRAVRKVNGKSQSLGSYHQCYRLDGRLIAMGVLDLLPHCVSGVYMLYHSDYEKWQFGKLSALREAALAIEGGYQYYYMGYYIHSCTKMRYKGDYKPQYVLDPESYDWNPLDGQLRCLLDTKSYVSMSRERARKDSLAATDVDGKTVAESSGDDVPEFPLPTAAEAGVAVRNGMSLFDLKIPGVMTEEEIESSLDLGSTPIRVRGRHAEVQHLVSWDDGNIRQPHSIKGIVGELVACLGPEAASQVEPAIMSSSPLTLVVRPRGRPIKGLPESITVDSDAPVSEIFRKIASVSKFSIHRLRVTKGSDGSAIPNAAGVTIHQTGLRNKSAVDVKDLGPQISWRTVFIVEYLGPMLIHPLVYFARPWLYGTDAPATQLQKLTLIMCVLHFAKREYETLFVHRFSSATMPAANIVKNSGHYWLLSGLNLAYWSYGPNSPAARPSTSLLTYLGVALFAIGEICNFSTHLTLKNLRRPGSTERGIPQGLGFNLVTCPNYLFEAIAWIGVALVNRSLSTVLFIVIAVGQMGAWAWKKERRYRKEFGDKYKRKRSRNQGWRSIKSIYREEQKATAVGQAKSGGRLTQNTIVIDTWGVSSA